MMVNAGRQPFPASVAICGALAALLVVRYRMGLDPTAAPFEGGMPLAAALVRLSTDMPWVAAVMAAVLVTWTLMVVVQITVRFAPASGRNYLPPQLLIIGAGGVAVGGETLAAMVGAWLLVLGLRGFAFSFRKGYRFSEVFHAGFFLGCLPLLYAPAAAVVPLVTVAAVAVYRRSLREAVVALVGMGVAVPAAGFVYWAAGEPAGFIYRELWRCATVPTHALGLTPWPSLVIGGLVAALAAIAVVWGHSHRKSFRNTPYRFLQHAALTLLFVSASAALPGSTATLVPLAAVPCAAVSAFAFHGRAAVVSTAIYIAVVAAVLLRDLPALAGL